MITDITIGQYFPGDSVVHKMDSRMKIILTVLLRLFLIFFTARVSRLFKFGSSK